MQIFVHGYFLLGFQCSVDKESELCELHLQFTIIQYDAYLAPTTRFWMDWMVMLPDTPPMRIARLNCGATSALPTGTATKRSRTRRTSPTGRPFTLPK